MIFNLFLAIFIGYEIQRILQFNLFFRLRAIAHDYKNAILKKTNSIAYSEIVKIGFIEIGYSIICAVGLFTINSQFFCLIFILSLLQNFIFKHIKNKTIRKISFGVDILLSILILTLSFINSIFFKLNDIQLITHLFNI